MREIKLGPEGSEITLPPINWTGGLAPDIPVGMKSAAERADMLDGSARWNYKTHAMRTWTLEWARLTAAQVEAIRALEALRAPLRFQNNYIDSSWTWVVITELSIRPKITTFASSTPLYGLSITLEETK